MTSDEFHAHYRPLEPLGPAAPRASGAAGGTGADFRTYRAREADTGRAVMVHLRDAAGADEVDRIHRLIALLPAPDRGRVLETATIPEGFAVVTEELPALASFGAWLAERTAATGGPQLGRPPVAGMASGPVPVVTRPPASPEPERDAVRLPPTGEMPVAFAFSVGGPPPGETADAGNDGAPPSAEYTRLFVLGGEAHLETQATPPSGVDLGDLILPGTGEREAPAAAQARPSPAAPRPAVGRGTTPARPRVAVPAPRRALPLVAAAVLLLVAVAAAVFLLTRSRSVPAAAGDADPTPADSAAGSAASTAPRG